MVGPVAPWPRRGAMGKPLTRRPVAGYESDFPPYVATIFHASLAATVCEQFSRHTATLALPAHRHACPPGNTVTVTPATFQVVVPIPRSPPSLTVPRPT
jgi:hypothetical protein